MSKAAQGLNDQLYVSGNSEQKMAAVQSASQKRVQHIARRFAETGMKRLCVGVYKTMKTCLKTNKHGFHYQGAFREVDVMNLPMEMECDIFLDIGENSNANKIQKLGRLGQEILPQMNQSGIGNVIKPEAPALLATKLVEAMGLNSQDFFEDYTTDEFKQKAAQAAEEQTKEAQRVRQLEQAKQEADVQLAQANVTYTQAQAKNTEDDNAKQLAVAIDMHYQQWAELAIKAVKEGAEIPPHPEFNEIIKAAGQIMGQQQPQQNQGGQ